MPSQASPGDLPAKPRRRGSAMRVRELIDLLQALPDASAATPLVGRRMNHISFKNEAIAFCPLQDIELLQDPRRAFVMVFGGKRWVSDRASSASSPGWNCRSNGMSSALRKARPVKPGRTWISILSGWIVSQRDLKLMRLEGDPAHGPVHDFSNSRGRCCPVLRIKGPRSSPLRANRTSDDPE